MVSIQMPGKVSASGDTAWLKGKLRYINEAFMTEFSSPGQASAFIRTYEDDAALQKDMPFDTFVDLHEKGDACVIIDRFVVLDRIAYLRCQACESLQETPALCFRSMPFAAAVSC